MAKIKRIISIVKEPHIGYKLVDGDGNELGWKRHYKEAYPSIWFCEFKLYVEFYDNTLGVCSVQYEEVLWDYYENLDYLRPYYGCIDERTIEEFVYAYMLEDEGNISKEESIKHILDILRRCLPSNVDDTVYEKYGIQKNIQIDK